MDETRTSSLLYDGLTDVRRFVKIFKLHAIHKAWTAANQLAYLPDMLTGKAERVFNALNETTERDTIVHALAALITKLAKPKEELMMLFYAEKRRSDEPLSRFAFRLQEMLVSALPEATEDILNQLLRANILNHVPDHIRSLIIFNPNMPWDDVLVSLDKSMPQASHNLSSGSSRHPTPLVKTEPSVNYASSIQQPRFNNNQRSNQRQQQGGHGHQHQQYQGNQQQSQRFTTSNKYCSFHNSNSHNDDECRMKKQAGANQQHQSSPQQYKAQSSTFTKHHNNNNYNSNKANSNNSFSNDIDGRYNYPYEANSDTVSLALVSAAASSDGASLLKVSTQMALFDQQPRMVTALIDGGSTHSFISPDVLTEGQLDIASKLPRYNYDISGIAGIAQSACNRVDATIGIGNWRGTHRFILSHKIKKHEMLLGRDFLTHHHVKVDHGSNVVTIEVLLMGVAKSV